MAPVPVRYFSPREVSQILGVSQNTVRNMIKNNHLEAFQMPPGNHYKVTADEVLRYVAEHNLPLPYETKKMLDEMTIEKATQ